MFFFLLLVLAALQQELQGDLDKKRDPPPSQSRHIWAIILVVFVSNVVGATMLGFSAYQKLQASMTST